MGFELQFLSFHPGETDYLCPASQSPSSWILFNFSTLWFGLLMNQWIPWKEKQLRLLDLLLYAFLLSGILAPQVLPIPNFIFFSLSSHLCQNDKGSVPLICLLTLVFSLPSQSLHLYCLWIGKWLGESSRMLDTSQVFPFSPGYWPFKSHFGFYFFSF